MKPKSKQAEFVKWFGPTLDALRQLGGSGRPKEVLNLKLFTKLTLNSSNHTWTRRKMEAKIVTDE
jgi:restriction system protein